MFLFSHVADRSLNRLLCGPRDMEELVSLVNDVSIEYYALLNDPGTFFLSFTVQAGQCHSGRIMDQGQLRRGGSGGGTLCRSTRASLGGWGCGALYPSTKPN